MHDFIDTYTLILIILAAPQHMSTKSGTKHAVMKMVTGWNFLIKDTEGL